jgi:type II secretory pathway component GspD/PulD (secretin)
MLLARMSVAGSQLPSSSDTAGWCIAPLFQFTRRLLRVSVFLCSFMLLSGVRLGSAQESGQPSLSESSILEAAEAETAEAEIAVAEATVNDDSIETQPPSDVRFRFSFSGAPWREVLNWLADESGMALHVGDLPAGSFTYSDPSEFTIDEAISRVNLFLIPQGYSIVKRGTLLSAISLVDPRSLQQLDALATPTSIADLANRSEHEIVKCMVPLGDVAADVALSELKPLSLMLAPVLLPKSNQLIVTETAGKVRSVIEVLRALEVPKAESVVRRFELRYVDVATVMMVVGSHLGLPAGGTEGPEVSISTDFSGRSLYVTGSPEKLARLESFIKILDVAEDKGTSVADMKLRSYPITGDNLQDVYNVLQTILEGSSLRLSMQPSTKSIVAFADETVHRVIGETIKEMQAPAVEFAVIDLNSLDPYFVVSLIGEMFKSGDSSSVSRDRRTSDETLPPAPKVDADPGNRRLFVRGTAVQIDQIKQMVANLDTRKAPSESVRVLPFRGQTRQQVLETAGRIWQGGNRVFILPSADAIDDQTGPIERVIHSEPSSKRPVSMPNSPSPGVEDRFEAGAVTQPLTDPLTSESLVSVNAGDVVHVEGECAAAATPAKSVKDNAIRGQLIPEGILLQSNDLEALDRFQNHILEVAESARKTPSPPVIYYLKYVNAEDAVKMLADLLDGGRSLVPPQGGTLINASPSRFSGSSYSGSLTWNKEGVTTVTAGTATIVSDARLNRLIVQGTTEDIAVIDEYMKIVDKGSSITDIETYGRSHVIELKYTKATEVAEMIKQAFAARIAANPQANPQASRTDARDADPKTADSNRGGDDQRREIAEKPTRGRLPLMTVTAHQPSNSVVITATDALFAEVQTLVRSIDSMSEQVVEVIPAKDGVDLEMILRTLNGESVDNNRGARRTASPSSTDRSRDTTRRSR